jgi:putative tricarboxylic transport membrane protein
MPRLHSSIWFGVGMLVTSILFAVFVIPHYVVKPSNVRILVLSPDFWPYIVAALMGIGGVALLAQYFFLTRAVAAPVENDTPPGGGLRTTLIGVLMIVYYLIMPMLGMVWSSVVAYMAFMAIVGLPRKLASIIVAIALPLALYAFFAHAAGVPIPQASFLVLP